MTTLRRLAPKPIVRPAIDAIEKSIAAQQAAMDAAERERARLKAYKRAAKSKSKSKSDDGKKTNDTSGHQDVVTGVAPAIQQPPYAVTSHESVHSNSTMRAPVGGNQDVATDFKSTHSSAVSAYASHGQVETKHSPGKLSEDSSPEVKRLSRPMTSKLAAYAAHGRVDDVKRSASTLIGSNEDSAVELKRMSRPTASVSAGSVSRSVTKSAQTTRAPAGYALHGQGGDSSKHSVRASPPATHESIPSVYASYARIASKHSVRPSFAAKTGDGGTLTRLRSQQKSADERKRVLPNLSAPAKRPTVPPTSLVKHAPVFAPDKQTSSTVKSTRSAVLDRRPISAARFPAPRFQAAADPVFSGCSPCSIVDEVPFCVRVPVPNGFTVVAGASVCVALQTANVSCESTACEQVLTGITLDNPCDPLSFITCSGTVTLYKLRLGGKVDVLVNLPISSTNPSDIKSCPASDIQLSRLICVPIDNDLCIGCSPIDCSLPGMTLVASVIVMSVSEALAAGSGCEAVWEIQGLIGLNSALCTSVPPPVDEFIISTCYMCRANPLFLGNLELRDGGDTIILQTIVGAPQNVLEMFAPVPPGTYVLHFTNAVGDDLRAPVPVTVVNQNVTVLDGRDQTCFNVGCTNGTITTSFTCESGAGTTLVFSTAPGLAPGNQDALPGETVVFTGPAGTYTVNLTNMFNFPIASQPGVIITTGNNTTVTFAIDCPFDVTGTVFCPNFNEDGYTVSIVDATTYEVAWTTVIDSSGNFVLQVPVSGSYRLVVRNSDATVIFVGDPMTLSGPTDLGFITIDCQVLSGLAIDNCDPPVDLTTYTVALYTMNAPPSLEAAGGPILPSGEFYVPLSGVPDGDFILVITDGSGTPVFSQVVTHTGVPIQVGNVLIECPETIEPNTLQVCFDGTSCSSPPATASLFDSANVLIQTVPLVVGLCGISGSFQFTLAPAGFYSVRVFDSGNVQLTQFGVVAVGNTTVSASC
jgi:hypothetical protein